MRKFLKIVLTVSILIILNSLVLLNSVYAVNLGDVNVYSAGDCGELLKYKGVTVKTTYAEYDSGSGLYPAYCLDKTQLGVGEIGDYNVDASSIITDVRLWRIIVNGYPYKSLGELGVENAKEAFTATKQAVYCYVHGNDIDDYEAIGEEGERTLSALKQILEDANSSSETQKNNLITINRISEDWKQEGNYIAKNYNIEHPANMNNYYVELKEIDKELPEGIKIVNTSNEEEKNFLADEEFKIMIPIQNLKDNGNFKILVKGRLDTKPVLYGKSYNSNYQDYALTGITYEEGVEEITENYYKNNTQITIDKKDKETGEKLEGIEFEILNENKNIIYTNLKTDKEGKIVVKALIPGKYYLRETKAKEGYLKSDDLIEINVDYNQDFTITVNNTKVKQPNVEYNKVNEQVTIKKLPVAGM